MAVGQKTPALQPAPPESSDASLLPDPQILDPIDIGARAGKGRKKPPILDVQPLVVAEPSGFDSQLRAL